MNGAKAYREEESSRISLYLEEFGVDEDLNDILCGSVMGAKSPRPRVLNGWRLGTGEVE